MRQKKIISLPTNDVKIYKQILAFLNFMLNITPQERDVLAELIKLDNDYEALPQERRAKFILSTDMRKEIREALKIEEKQFNVIISRLRSKTLMGIPLIGEHNEIHPELKVKPDSDGFTIEIHLVNTIQAPKKIETPKDDTPTNIEEEIVTNEETPIQTSAETISPPVPPGPPEEAEEEEFVFTIEAPKK